LPVFSAPIHKANVRVELVSDVSSIAPDEAFGVGLQMDMDDGWHTYWLNSGDSGLPTRMEWVLPEGFTAGETHWPYPKRFDYSGRLTGYGYDGTILLLTQIKAPENIKVGEDHQIRAKISWLSCREICIPGKAELSISLGVAHIEAHINDDVRKLFNNEKLKWPIFDGQWNVTAIAQKEAFILNISSDTAFEKITGASFFPLPK